MEIIEQALKEGRASLSEFESKLVLKEYGIPITREALVRDSSELLEAEGDLGYPLVLKACSPEVAHKTEKGLIHTDLRRREELMAAYEDLAQKLRPSGQDGILVQEMASGKRELVAGMTRDPQFGPCVMFGLGGIFTEILNDVSFRVAPIDESEAMDMMGDIRGAKILDGIRGMPEADRSALARILVAIGSIGLENEAVNEIDINPLILSGPDPVAVDALIVLRG